MIISNLACTCISLASLTLLPKANYETGAFSLVLDIASHFKPVALITGYTICITRHTVNRIRYILFYFETFYLINYNIGNNEKSYGIR